MLNNLLGPRAPEPSIVQTVQSRKAMMEYSKTIFFVERFVLRHRSLMYVYVRFWKTKTAVNQLKHSPKTARGETK